MLAIFMVVNSERLVSSLGKESEICFSLFTSSTKIEIRHFHVVVPIGGVTTRLYVIAH